MRERGACALRRSERANASFKTPRSSLISASSRTGRRTRNLSFAWCSHGDKASSDIGGSSSGRENGRIRPGSGVVLVAARYQLPDQPPDGPDPPADGAGRSHAPVESGAVDGTTSSAEHKSSNAKSPANRRVGAISRRYAPHLLKRVMAAFGPLVRDSRTHRCDKEPKYQYNERFQLR